MKTATQVFLLFIALLFSGAVLAQNRGVSTEGLSREAQLELENKALQLQLEGKTAVEESITDPENLQRWADIGTGLGKALSGAAKELGTGVNEFAKTDVGLLVTVVVLWKLLASELMLAMVGLFFLVVGNAVLLRIYWKRSFVVKTEFSPEGKKLQTTKTTNPEAWELDSNRELHGLTLFFWGAVFNNVIAVSALIAV